MSLFYWRRFGIVGFLAILVALGSRGLQTARGDVAISMSYPLAASPCDTLSVTTLVVNAGATLSQLQVSENLPGGNSYQYVTNSMQITVSGGVTITNEAGVLTINNGTNLFFNLSSLQSTNGPTSLLISQVFPGAATNQDFIQLYNPTLNPISLAGWSIRNDRPGVTNQLPGITIGAGEFVILAGSTNFLLAAYPSLTNQIIQLSDNFGGNGLAQYADGLFLMNPSGVVVDQLSWGFDTSAMNPSVPYPTTTSASLARVPANVDTGTANDWQQLNTPTPGTGTVQNGVASGTSISIVYQLTAQCGGVGGYFNSSASYQQPPGSATQTNTTVDFIAFENPVLLVSKTPQIQQATAGGLVTWTLQLQNSGFGVAHNSVLYDSIGSGLTFVSFSIPPTATNTVGGITTVNWDETAIPALAGVTNKSTVVSVVVTARLGNCPGDLSNRGDASFGCNSLSLCQDTRSSSSGATTAIEPTFNRPYLTFSLAPANPIIVPYCGGLDLTLSVTNNNYINGADAAAIAVSPNLVTGYTLLYNGVPLANSTPQVVSLALARGTATNIILHLEPTSGICPVNTNLVSQLLTPLYNDNCGTAYAAPTLALSSEITGLSSALVTETYNPTSLQANKTNILIVTADLLYTNMGSVAIPQSLVQSYPAGTGWSLPYAISGGGVLSTSAGTITWTTNATGSGDARFTFQINDTNHCDATTAQFLLTPAAYLDCVGCPQSVNTSLLNGSISTSGCGGGGGGCTIAAVVTPPISPIEDCASQPFTMTVTNLTGTFGSRWTNVIWTASLAGGFTYNSGTVNVTLNGTNITSFLNVSYSGTAIQVAFSNLNTMPEFTNVTSTTNLQIAWNGAVSQTGTVNQSVGFNLCSGSEFYQQWIVGTSALNVTLTPPFLGFACGKITVPIGLHQVANPLSVVAANNALYPDYDVEVILNLDPVNDPGSVGSGSSNPTLRYVTNSATVLGITNLAGSVLVLTNPPAITNNLVIWHVGSLGVFTNGTLNCQFQFQCGGAPVQYLLATVRYNNRCAQGTLPQTLSSVTPQQLVSDQAAALQMSVSPSTISMSSTNFNFQVEVENTLAAPAVNFFIEVQVPTNIVLTSATVPWDYVTAVNRQTNAYFWAFTNNIAPLQGLIDALGDGSFNDLAYQGSFILSVNGSQLSCGNDVITTTSGSGCFGTECETVGPLPVVLQPFSGEAVAMLVFPTTLPICTTNALYYDVRNAGLSAIYNIAPTFFLPAGLEYVSGSAVATNVATGQSMSIPDPTGAGTALSPFTWNSAQVSYLAELDSGNDVIIGFQVKADCDTTVSGQGGAQATYYDICGSPQGTALELSDAIIGVPVLSLNKVFSDVNGHARSESIPGETNVFYLTIKQTAQSQADVRGMQLIDFFPTNSFAFLGASIAPDATNGGILVWSNTTLMAAIPNEPGGPFSVTNPATISLVVTSLTLAECSSPVLNSAVLNYGCASSLCQSASASASVAMTPDLQIESASESLQLNSCGGTYSVTVVNNGAPATFIQWTNYAPAGYLIAAASLSGSLYTQPGQFATLALGGTSPYTGKYAVLNLASTASSNVYGTTNYPNAPGSLFLAPGQSFTVTYMLVSDGSTLNCTVNDYPPAPVPVTVTNAITFINFCGSPATVGGTFTALPDQPKPAVVLTPSSVIVTNGQVQNFAVTIENIGTHGNASDLAARVLFQAGWTNVVILGVVNNATGSSTNILVETNAQNGVLASLGGIQIAPLQTVTINLQATALQNSQSLGVTAEVIGGCGSPSPNACASFSPTTPLAMTMPPSANIATNSNNTIYGYYQAYASAVGFTLSKTVRYVGESASVAGTNRVARIGENLVYQIVATFFDAPFTNIVVTDSLPPNLVYGTPVDAGSSANASGWTYNPATGSFTLPTPISNGAQFIVDFPVTVTNGFLNRSGVAFTNSASASFATVVTNQPSPVSTLVTEVEPVLYVTNLVSPTGSGFASSITGIQAGDTLYYQMVITNTSGTNAYDLWLSNSLPAGFTGATVVSVTTSGTVLTNGVAAGSSLITSLVNFTNNSANVGTNELDIYTNSSLTVVISAKVGYSAMPLQTILDNATIQWSSLPGAAAQERTGVGLIPPPGVNEFTNQTILNNYADTSTAAAATVMSPTFGKTLVGGDHTAAGLAATNVVVGERVFYNLTLTVPQGQMTNVQVFDTLPVGLGYVGVTNVIYSTGVSNSQPILIQTNTQANVVVAGSQVTFNLGNVTNVNSGDAPATLTIQMATLVLDTNFVNRAGAAFTNLAYCVSGPFTSAVSTSAVVTVMEPVLQVSELVGTNTTSVFTPGVNTVQAKDPIYYQITITNAGANFTNTTAYNLWVSNSLPLNLTGATVVSATTYGSVYTNNSVLVTSGALSPGMFVINANNVLTNVASSHIALDSGASLVLLVSGTLSATINPNTVLLDTNTIAWASLPGIQTNLTSYAPFGNSRTGVSTPLPAAGVNNYVATTLQDNYSAASAVTTATVINPGFVKTLTSEDFPGTVTSPLPAGDVVVGERAFYTLTITVPQGVTPNGLIVDTLPASLGFVGVTNVSASSGVTMFTNILVETNTQNPVIVSNLATAFKTVYFTLGNLTNVNTGDTPSTLSIEIATVVLNTNFVNRAGAAFTNVATFTSTGGTGGAYTSPVSVSAPLTVLEPVLQVSELVGTNSTSVFTPSVNSVQANDPLYYQITITNAAANFTNATAFNLWVSNSLPASLTGATVTSVTVYGNVYTNNNVLVPTGLNGLSPSLFFINPNNVLTNVASSQIALDPGASIVLLVSGTLSATINPKTVLLNTNTIQWASLPGVQTNLSCYGPFGSSRTGVSNPQPGAGANNYEATTFQNNYSAASAVTTATVLSPGFVKTLTSGDFPGSATSPLPAGDVVIGERVFYTFTLTVPQGQMPLTAITDTLPQGLGFVGVTNITYSSGVSCTTPPLITTNAQSPQVVLSGTAPYYKTVTFNLGTVQNNNNNDQASTLTLEIATVVLDTNVSRWSASFTNIATCTATLSSGAYNSGSSISAPVTVVEPALQVTELVGTNTTSVFTPTINSVQGNNSVYYLISITNNGLNFTNVTAYNLYESNSLPSQLTSPTVMSITTYGNVYTNNATLVTSGGIDPSMFGINPANNVLTNVPTSQIALDPGASIVLLVSGTLSSTLNPASVMIDTNTIQWSSLPGTQTNLSSYSPFGNSRTGVGTPQPIYNHNNFTQNGGTTGNWILDNYAAGSATTTITSLTQTFTKVLTSTSQSNIGNGNTNAVIGELVKYTLSLTVPQGQAPNAIISDGLPPNMAFVNISAVTTPSGVVVQNPVAVNSTANLTIGNTNGGTGNWVIFNLGNIQNNNTGNATEIYVIAYNAVVLDSSLNTNRVALSNYVAYASGNVSLNNSASEVKNNSVEVVEPMLQVSELIGTNSTVFTPGVASVQGYDTIYYQIVITNTDFNLLPTNGTTAYSLWLSNSLPAGFVNPVVTSVSTVGPGKVYTNNTTQVTGVISPGMFGIGLDNGLYVLTNVPTANFALDSTSCVVIVVSGKLGYGVNPLQAITNNTFIEWASLPGPQTSLTPNNPAANLRNGASISFAGVNYATNFSTNTMLLDNYGAVSPAAVATVIGQTFSKVLNSTSVSNPGNQFTNAVIGELAAYTLSLTVPQGTTPNTVISDVLPPGLAFDNVTAVTTPGGVTVQNPVAAGSTANLTIGNANGGTGNSVSFNLGNVVNNNTSDATVTYAISFNAVVVDALANRGGVSQSNSVSVVAGNFATNNLLSAAGTAVQVVEPTLQLSELISADNVNYGPTLANVDAGNTVYYQIVITNTSYSLPTNGTTAYNLWVSNSLPAGLINPQVVSVTAGGTGGVYTNNTTLVSGNLGTAGTGMFGIYNNVLTNVPSANFALDTNGSLVIVVSGVLAASVEPSQAVTDNTFIEWASLPGPQTSLTPNNPAANLRNGASVSFANVNYATNFSTNTTLLDNYAAASALTVVTVPPPVLSKGIVATDEPGVTGNSGVIGTNATIGELVTYRITVYLPEGTTPNLSVTDTLPAGMAYVAGSINLTSSRPANANVAIPGTGTEAFGGVVAAPTVTSPANPVNGAITFSFGSITVNPDNDPNNNVFSFTYQAVVLNLPANSGLASNPPTLLNNTFTWVGGLASGNGLVDPSGTVVAVVEPNLNLTQSVLVNGISQTCAYLGSPVVYTISIQPTVNSLSTAFNLGFTDQLPSILGATPSTPLTMANLVITNSAGVDLRSNFSLVNNLLTTNGFTLSLATNDTITIVVTGVVTTGSSAGAYLNQPLLSYSSRNGNPVAQYTPAGGFDPNPYVTTDQERGYTASSSLAISLNISTLAGYVYADANDNGLKDAGEPGLAGVTVTLTGINLLGQSVNLSTTTAGDGSYLFGSLVPGPAYTLTRTSTPAGYVDGFESAGTPFGGVANLTPGSTAISAINIPTCASDAGVNYNFGLVQLNSLAGIVFADLNRNGIEDGADYALTNVTIILTGTNDQGSSVSNVLQTLSDGSYDFTNLRPGTNYSIQEIQPAGYAQGTNALGSLGGVNSAQDVFSSIVLTQNQNGTAYNFGETLGSLSGSVFIDVNGNGIADANDTNGISAVTIALYQGGTLTGTTTTAADGSYGFTNLLLGNYTVTQFVPVGYTNTTITNLSVTLTNATPSTNNNFLDAQPAAIGDYVWVDSNADGLQDNGELGLSGVTVTLYQTNSALGTLTAIATTTSSSAGAYSFTSLLPNPNYVVGFSLPSGYVYTVPNAGSNTNINSQVGANGLTAVIGLTSGQTNNSIDAGYHVPLFYLSGTVFNDTNGLTDGLVNGSVTNLNGALYANLVAASGNVLANQPVAANGNYLFTNLVSGSYTVQLTTNAGVTGSPMPLTGLPAGWGYSGGSVAGVIAGNTNGLIPVSVVAANVTGVNFGIWQLGTIGDYTWLDLNANGLQDVGEPAAVGVTEILYASNAVTSAYCPVATNMSSASGFYEFTNVPPGIYQVSFSMVLGSFKRSPQLVGSDTNINSAPSETTGLTYFFTLAPGQTNLSMNAGYAPASTPVDIVSLTAVATPDGVLVTWRTYDELDLLAFDVARSTAGGPAQDVTPDYVLADGQDLGAKYQVTDVGATAPGVYTYTLYGIDDNLTVENKGTVTVRVASSVAPGSAPVITSLTISDGTAVLNWSGGQPPYVVEQSSSLGANANWQPVGTAQTGTQMVLTNTATQGFFRVVGSQ